MLKITIIGHGFVGKAVDYAFQDDVEKQIIDPKYNLQLPPDECVHLIDAKTA